MSTISSKDDIKNAKMASRAADLSSYAQAVWKEKDFHKKKLLAIEFAKQFQVGGKQDFVDDVIAITSTAKLDQLVTNAMLKGEGMSTKRF